MAGALLCSVIAGVVYILSKFQRLIQLTHLGQSFGVIVSRQKYEAGDYEVKKEANGSNKTQCAARGKREKQRVNTQRPAGLLAEF